MGLLDQRVHEEVFIGIVLCGFLGINKRTEARDSSKADVANLLFRLTQVLTTESRAVPMTEDDIDVLDTEEPDSDAVAAYYAEFDKGSDREVRRMVEPRKNSPKEKCLG